MTASEKLEELEDAVRELLAALGPCGDIDKKGNCRNHFATCPCEVEEVKRVMNKRLASHDRRDNTAGQRPARNEVTNG